MRGRSATRTETLPATDCNPTKQIVMAGQVQAIHNPDASDGAACRATPNTRSLFLMCNASDVPSRAKARFVAPWLWMAGTWPAMTTLAWQ
jgi:hypothetical protein